GAACGARGIGRMEDTFHLYITRKSFFTLNEILYSSFGTHMWGAGALRLVAPSFSIAIISARADSTTVDADQGLCRQAVNQNRVEGAPVEKVASLAASVSKLWP